LLENNIYVSFATNNVIGVNHSYIGHRRLIDVRAPETALGRAQRVHRGRLLCYDNSITAGCD